MNKLCGGLMLFALLSGATGCGRPASSRGVPVQLATTAGATGHLPAELAESLGFYRQEGLDVTITRMSSSAKVMEALIGGSAEVACAGQQHLVQLAAEGKSVQAFVAEFNNPGYSLVVSPAVTGRFARVEDLKGAVVGVSAPGGGHYTFLNYVLSKHGMSARDLSIVAIGVGAPSLAALERGKVSAAVADLVTIGLLKRRYPNLTLLADTSTPEGMRSIFGSETSYQYTLCAASGWLRQNRDTARRLAAAIVRTLRWMREHSPEQVREKLPAASRTPDAESDVEALRVALPFFSTDGVISAESARVAREAAAATVPKVATADIDLSSTYTNDLVRQ